MVSHAYWCQKEPNEKIHLNKNIFNLLSFLTDFLKCPLTISLLSHEHLKSYIHAYTAVRSFGLSTLCSFAKNTFINSFSILPKKYYTVTDLKNPGKTRTLLRQRDNQMHHFNVFIACLFFFFFLFLSLYG